jgi:small subunit ribosomal protein S9
LIDDETKDAQDTSDEGTEAEAAGPVAGEDSSSSQAAGEEPTPTPPADEASEAEAEEPVADGDTAEEPVVEEQQVDEEPAADGDAAEEPVAEEEQPETAEEQPETAEEQPETAEEAPVAEEPVAEKPKAEEKKKDVIPGADLEPIAVETAERPLSAEEQARKEAEEEERRQREAALVGDSEEEPSAASRAPAKLEGDARYLATGKRKTSIARVTLLPGSGKAEFFPRPLHQTIALQPLTITGYEGNVDVRVRVHGGGISGQAGAVRHGIARALTEIDPELRGELKRRGFLTRDARAKERKKAGLKKARKRPQFSKR